MDHVDTHIVVEGTRRTVEYAVRDDGTMPARDFVESLEAREKAAVQSLLQLLADVGEEGIHNTTRFRRERDAIWAVKRKATKGKREKSKEKRASSLIRLPCFRDENRWILTHGFWKPPKPKWPEAEYKLAFEIMNEQLSREAKKKGKQP